MWMILFGGLRRRWPEHLLAAVVIAAVVAGLGALRATSAAAEAEVHDIAHRLGRNMLLLPADVAPADFYAQRYQGGLLDSAPGQIKASPAGAHIKSMEARLYGNLEVQGRPIILVGQDFGWPTLPDGRVPAVAGAAAARALGLQAGGTLPIGAERLAILEVTDQPPDGLDSALFLPVAEGAVRFGITGGLVVPLLLAPFGDVLQHQDVADQFILPVENTGEGALIVTCLSFARDFSGKIVFTPAADNLQ